MKKQTTVSFPILGILGICFIILKLCHVIDWSWWYVTLPFWGLWVVLFVLFIFTLLFLILKDFIYKT